MLGEKVLHWLAALPFCSPEGGHVTIDLQNSCGSSPGIAHQHLTAFDDHLLAVAACVDEISFPLPFLFQHLLDGFKRLGEAGLEKQVYGLAYCFLFLPPVEFFCATVPGHDAI